MRVKPAALLAVLAVSAGTSGPALASGTTTKPQDVCLAKTRDAIAHSLGVSAASVRIGASQGTNGMPQCSYVVQRPRTKLLPHSSVHLIVNVDSAPQASWRLMRKVVEASQIFGPPPPGWHAPIGLYGLGQYASWFIDLDSLMCVNHTRTKLLTVTVSWRHAKQAERIALARATVEPYIHAPAKAVPIPISGY